MFKNSVFCYLHEPVELLVTLPHESVQMVTEHVPRSGMVVDCVVQVGCPTGEQAGRPGIAGTVRGEVGIGVAGRVNAKVAFKVGVRVSVSVGVIVLVSVMVLVDVGVGGIVGVEVREEVGVNVLVGLENVIFICPQAESTRLIINIREIRFAMFILPPASILHLLIQLMVTGQLLICLPAKIPGFHFGFNPLKGYEWSAKGMPNHPPWKLVRSITFCNELNK
jgi:hypothetical protein